MILKKKIINTKYFIILKFFFKKIFYSLGILSFITIFIIVIYYFSSGLQRKFNPSELFLQINDKILKKYVGFDFRLIPDYVYIASLNLSKHLRSNDLPNFYDVNRVSQINVGRLTNAYPGILFKFSGLLSPIVLLFILILFYFDVVIFVSAIRNINFSFLLIFQLFVMLRSAIYMGDLGQFFIFSFILIGISLVKKIFYGKQV